MFINSIQPIFTDFPMVTLSNILSYFEFYNTCMAFKVYSMIGLYYQIHLNSGKASKGGRSPPPPFPLREDNL